MTQSSDSGSVKVAVRLRPLNKKELASSKSNKGLRAWRVHENRGIDGKVTQRSIRQTGEEKAIEGKSLFSFDEVFDEDAATDDIYDAVGSVIVKGAVDGRNGTIFAYGQTGSGKTYTMQGNGLTGSIPKDGVETEAVDGIIQKVAWDLFGRIESDPAREFLLRASFVEVYNETIRDLLHDHDDAEHQSIGSSSASSKSPKKQNRSEDHNNLNVRDDPKTGGVSLNCKEVIVTDVNSLMGTLYNGEKNRIVASTDMNARSSRSHSIFSITIESRESQGVTGSNRSLGAWDEEEDDRAVLVSMLNLVDLAGSESTKTTNAKGTRQREGGKINQSLLTLSQVIQSLSMPKGKRPSHINYRDSKLTRILRPSLEGNAVMAILCCATASRMYVEETKSTLRFASRAKLVQTSAKKNEVMDDRALIRRLQKELADAKEALKQMEVEKGQPKVSYETPQEDNAEDPERKTPMNDHDKRSQYRKTVSQLSSVMMRGGSVRNVLGGQALGELDRAMSKTIYEEPQRRNRQPRASIKFQDHIVDLPFLDDEDEESSDEEHLATPEAEGKVLHPPLLENENHLTNEVQSELPSPQDTNNAENTAAAEHEQRATNTPLENENHETAEVQNGLSLPQDYLSSEDESLKAALEEKSILLTKAEARIRELEQELANTAEKNNLSPCDGQLARPLFFQSINVYYMCLRTFFQKNLSFRDSFRNWILPFVNRDADIRTGKQFIGSS
mmetsp:Transcript_31394/g.47684  ORF Transcript_31394/g.47684 Transcript_31394/m.47684 type:complete len:729 (+) Transcript_31394:290-2476(+)